MFAFSGIRLDSSGFFELQNDKISFSNLHDHQYMQKIDYKGGVKSIFKEGSIIMTFTQ